MPQFDALHGSVRSSEKSIGKYRILRLRPLRPFVWCDNTSDIGAGWSSPVARQAHNLKVVGSNPTPATTEI